MIVVDTNIIAYAYIEGERTSLAQRVHELDAHWCIPTLWRHEFLNLLTVFVQHGGCDIKKAESYWQQAVINLSACEQAVDMPLVLSIAYGHKISAYDAQVIALAQSLDVTCITEDKILLKKFPARAVSMKTFCSSIM